MWIVRLALRRPYTFVVVALLILVLGVGGLNEQDRLLVTPPDTLQDGAVVQVAASAGSPR